MKQHETSYNEMLNYLVCAESAVRSWDRKWFCVFSFRVKWLKYKYLADKDHVFWSFNRTTPILQSPSHSCGSLCPPPFKCSYIPSTALLHIRFLDSLNLKYFTVSTKEWKLYNLPKRKDFAIKQIRACEQTAPSIL